MSIPGKISVVIGVILIAGVAGAIIYTFFQDAPSTPEFSYDASGIDGWYESQNGNLQALARSMGGEYAGQEPVSQLPVTDVSIHHGEKNAKEVPDDNCFVAFSYYDYALDDIGAAYDNYENRKREQGDLKVIEPSEKSVPTFEGNKSYELRRYDYAIAGKDVLSGYEVGFLNLESGHIRIEGVCKTVDDLAQTLPILDAVTLNK